MAAFLLFILAGVILVITFWNFKKKPAPGEDQRSDYLKTAVNKLRGDPKIHQNSSRWLFRSSVESRRDYYRNDYLKSEAWQRKRYVVLRRDNWRCAHCGARATQVHHKKYAKKNIGKEPIEWLESVCRTCHESLH